MAKVIRVPSVDGFRSKKAWAWDIYRLLGVKSLPVEGMTERLIDGVRVYVKPLSESARKNHGRRFSLRVMAICECGRHVAVGRLGQHVCK